MKKSLTTLLIFTLSALALVSCSGNLSIGKFSTSSITSGWKAVKSIAEGARGMSPMEEHFLGRAVSANVLSRYQPSHNSGLNRYLTKVGRTLAAYSSKPETYGGYHFRALESDEVNALAAPGGYIFVTTGLLKLLPNEDALAAVLAHEIAHIVHEDGVNSVATGKYVDAALTVGQEVARNVGNNYVQAGVGLLGNQVNGLVDTLITSGYSRSQEYSADQKAVQILTQAGYSPLGMVRTLKILEERAEHDSHGLFSTHPSPDDRLDNIYDEFDNIPEEEVKIAARDKRFHSQLKRLG